MDLPRQHILITGAGSIGTALGVLLGQSHEVVLMRRRGRQGFLDIRMSGEKEQITRLRVVHSSPSKKADIPAPDLIVVTSQRQQLDQILQDLQTTVHIREDTIFLVMQNGLESASVILKQFNNPVIQASVWWSAILLEDDWVYYHRKASTGVGIPRDSRADRDQLMLVYHLLADQFDVGLVEDVQTELRRKLLLNVVSPVLAMTKEAYPFGLSNFRIREIVHACFDEALHTAKSLGWDVDDPRLRNFHSFLLRDDIEGTDEKILHKVSTQIGAEKYGGKGSNARELLQIFVDNGAHACKLVLEEVEKLPVAYNPIGLQNLEKIHTAISQLDISCEFNTQNLSSSQDF